MTNHTTCRRCLYTTDHALGITIDSDGICSGCRIHEEKDKLDWSDRWSSLKKLVEPYKNKSGRNYDCIIPVTGANDSYYIVHTVKNRLGLNPLLVTYNKYFNTPLGIRNLANLRIKFNCDIVIQNVNPISVKNIVRTTLRKMGSIYWHCIAGQTVFPVQIAERYKIPLIIWGAHQGLEQTGMFSHEHEVEMTRRYRKDHDLMGFEADDLLSIFDSINEEDVWQYRYPDDKILNEIGVRGIYLGNYVRWDPKLQHEEMMKLYDYKTAPFRRTFDCYDHVDCFNYMSVHDMLKFYKHGYSKVTDHACREIRHGRLSRNQGAWLIQKHQNEALENFDLFCEWLNVDKHAINLIFDEHRSSKYWHKTSLTEWSFKSQVDSIDPINISKKAIFIASDKISYNKENNYVVIGKGFP